MRELFTPQEEVDEVERVIADLRQGKAPSPRGINALKSVAAGLRARMPGVPGKTLAALEGHLAGAMRTRHPELGYEVGALQVIAQTVIGKWHIIRGALERFEQETR